MNEPPMSILLVDDDPSILEILTDLMAIFGHDYVTARDGVEAIEKLKHSSFNIVITDMMMPNMDGITMAKKLRETDKSTVIIMVTTEAEKPRIIEAIKSGVNNYVVKPFTPDTLKAKIDETMKKAAQPA